jgi:Zn-dependent protease
MIEIPGRVPIRIHPIFWLLVILISWINSLSVMGSLIWAAVIVFSLLIHEYGHAFTALAFGQEARIDLMGMGGLTTRSGPQIRKWKEFLIVLDGPAAGLLLCLCAYTLKETFPAPPNSVWGYFLNITYTVNLFWTILNLVPVQPLDGGRMMGILLEGIFGVRGLRMSFFISMLIAGAVGVFFISIQALIAGALFFIFAFESYRGWNSLTQMSEEDRDVELQNALEKGEDLFAGGHYDEALEVFEKIMRKSSHGLLFQTALEHCAVIYAHKEQYPQAYLLLAPHRKELSQDGLELFHRVAYNTGHWDEVIQTGNDVYQIQPNALTAIINAAAYAHRGETRPAIGWLQNAIDQGLEDAPQVLSRPDFDPIRNDPAFQELLHQQD